MRHLRTLLWLLACGWFLILAMPADAVPGNGEAASEGLALSRVALFKSGVGYFELRGKARPGEAIPLNFKRSQMNDVLKSLTVINLSGGGVKNVVYDSTKTAAQELSEYAFEFRKGDGLPQILEQLQGCPIEIATGSSSVCGTIAGVEKRIATKDGRQIPHFHLGMIDERGQLRSFHTEEIASVRFLDRGLNEDLKRYLGILSRKHRRDEKTLVITPGGEGVQELSVSYVTEAPVWKATYRIVIPDEDKGAKPFLQGWAIVDNVSGTDWERVELSLVSGLPASFIQDLYDPQFVERPVVKQEEETFGAPAVPEEGVHADHVLKSAEQTKTGRIRSVSAPQDVGLMGVQEVNLENRMRDLHAAAAGREAGEMFEYKIDHRVAIQQNRSALVPIVAKEIDAEAVDLYNQEVRIQNPLAAVRLKNSTGLTLEGGPATVFQAGIYAGDALMGTLKPDQERYIAYAVDLGLHVQTQKDAKSEKVDRVVVNRGVVRWHSGVIETRTYTLENRDPRPKTVIIDHPRHPDWKLLGKEKPVEITDRYLRFAVKAPARETVVFAVREMRDRWESVMVANLTTDHIALFVDKEYLDQKTCQGLERIVVLKSEISAMDQDLRAIEERRNQIFKDQKRVRENLQGLGQTAEEKDLRSRYIKQLNEQETRLEKMAQEERALKRDREAKQAQLNDLIANLEQDLES